MSQPTPMASVALIDEFEVTVAGRVFDLSGPAQRLVAYVAVHDGPVNRRRIVADLWPDLPTATGLTRLRDALYRVRQAAPTLLNSTGHRVSISESVDIDAGCLLRRARGVLDGRMSVARMNISDVAPRELLPTWDDCWLASLRKDLALTCARALEYLAHDRIDQTRFHDAETACRLVIEAEPYRESAHMLLAQVFIAEGNPALALCAVQDYERRMLHELGLTPGRAVEYVERSIRESASAPYVGLTPANAL